MLKFPDHLPGGFTAKNPFRIPPPCETFGSPTRRKRIQINVYVGIFRQLLGGFTAKTTIRIPKYIRKFGLFTRRIYRENDRPKILEQTLYQVGYRENDPHAAETPSTIRIGLLRPTYDLLRPIALDFVIRAYRANLANSI